MPQETSNEAKVQGNSPGWGRAVEQKKTDLHVLTYLRLLVEFQSMHHYTNDPGEGLRQPTSFWQRSEQALNFAPPNSPRNQHVFGRLELTNNLPGAPLLACSPQSPTSFPTY